MIKLADISKDFAGKTILKNINLVLGNKQITGLIGDNGAGKTTLLGIINGEIEADSGHVEVQNESIGYLPQNPQYPHHQTVEQFLSASLKDTEQSFLIDKALADVRLSSINKNTLATTLSGGEKTRLYVASLLLSEPTFLLLDEPTNNLDIEGTAWLEFFLTGFNGGIFLTSHDRALLDNIVENILEIDQGEATMYGGNYSFYLEQKETARLAYIRTYSEQQKKIEKTEKNIREMQDRARQGEKQFSSRNPYVRRKIRKSAEQAANRKKRLEKFLESEIKLEKPEEKIKYSTKLAGKTNSGKSMLHVKNLSKTFSKKKILDNISFQITGRERVWLAGLNGSGKTTLLNLLIGNEKQEAGQIEIGAHVSIGYFSQERNDLTPDNRIIDEFFDLGLTSADGYKLAIRFGFTANDLALKIHQLSTGQKAKVACAKLTSGYYQLLLMDEPTNHLEIKTREILEDALNSYQGALLVSSHDRYFLEKISIDRVLTLHNGKVHF